MPGLFRFVLPVCAGLLAGGWAAFAADPPADGDFAFWQDELCGKEAGVYERGDSVFVVSRVPVTPRTRPQAKQADALLQASALLKRWVWEQTRGERGKEPVRPAAVAAMAAFNDQAAPGWRIPACRIEVPGRQFPSRELGGFYHQGQVYVRETLLAAVPEAFRRHPTGEEVAEAFAKLASAAYRKDPAAFAGSIPRPPAPLDAEAVADSALRLEELGQPVPARVTALLALGLSKAQSVREKTSRLLPQPNP